MRKTLADRIIRYHVLTDVLLWSALCLPVLWAGLTSAEDAYTGWETAAGLLLVGGAVALGRSVPPASMLLALTLWEASVVSRGETTLGIAPFLPAAVVMSYLAGVRMTRSRPGLLGLAGATALTALLVPALTGDLGAGFVAVVGVALFGAVPWLTGRGRHQHLELARSGWERAEQLERAQQIIADQARLRERTRIAGDMHDLLGHELSLIALRIGGLEVAPGLDARYRDAAGEARRAVTVASERLQEIIEVLHDDSLPSSPDLPGESVAELVERARASGVPVEAHGLREGRRLAPMVERAVHRVVQEALTNAVKHAAGAPVTVRLDHLADETVVTVTNGVPPAHPASGHTGGRGREGLPTGGAHGREGPAPREEHQRDGMSARGAHGREGPAPREEHRREGMSARGEHRREGRIAGGGHGLIGLAERVRLCGGTLRAERRGGGFELAVRLPHVPGPAGGSRIPSPSAARLGEARRRVRRARTLAVGAALATCAGAAVAVSGFMVYDTVTSALPAADFDRLRVGQDRAGVEAVLPARPRTDAAGRPGPPVPAGAECLHYGKHRNPFAERRGDLYRLCFRDGRLVGKDFLPASWPPPAVARQETAR
ncbi:sensor histidine kinase [Streptosporangium roseum]|uniref:sensor histidine kinase n=1 Tax=Streptosporangium roseum TaxID=2001 RepID=UPI00331A7328